MHAECAHAQRDQPCHCHVRQEMRAHPDTGDGDRRSPQTAENKEKPCPLFLALAQRRKQADQHRAGSAGGMAGGEGAEFIAGDTFGHQLLFQCASGLPPRGEIAFAGLVDLPHPNAAPWHLDEVDEEHRSDGNDDERQDEADDRFGGGSARIIDDSGACGSRSKDRDKNGDPDGHIRHIVGGFADIENEAHQNERRAADGGQRAPRRIDALPVDEQQAAGAGQRQKGGKLSERGEELAEAVFVAWIEQLGERKVKKRACDHAE